MIGNLSKSCQNVAEVHDGNGRRSASVLDGGRGGIWGYSVFLTSARDIQPITDSARGMVNTVYDSLLNGK
jgi:hypothetical protein